VELAASKPGMIAVWGVLQGEAALGGQMTQVEVAFELTFK
jgi:hypothetical protein